MILQITIDRYHVVTKYRRGADNLRTKAVSQLKTELSPDNLKLLQQLWAYCPDLKMAYALREQLNAIFEQQLTKEEATKEIEL